jgi:type IV pili sensor histidine kinase/response regulator
MSRKFVLLIAMFWVAATSAVADSSPVALATADPFYTYVRTTYPRELLTVREAVMWLLEDTNWSLVDGEFAPVDARSILNRPIEPIAKLPRTMSRLDALQVLIGAENSVVIDRLHRLISNTATARVMP